MTIHLKNPQPNFTPNQPYQYREFTHRFLERDGTHGVCLAREVIDDRGQPVWYTERPGVAWHRPWGQFFVDWTGPVDRPERSREKFDAKLDTFEREGNFTYYPAQRDALWKAELRGNAVLVGDTGTGKTLLGLTRIALQIGTHSLRALVIVPQAVIPQWVEEGKRFFPWLPFVTPEEEEEAYSENKVVVVTHREYLFHKPNVRATHLARCQYDVVLVDEVHNYSNPESLASKGLLNIRAHQRTALSATPISNRTGDLFPVLRWLGQLKFPYTLLERDRFIADCFTSDGSHTLQADKILNPLVVTLEKHQCRADVPKLNVRREKMTPHSKLKELLKNATPERQRQLLWTQEQQDQRTSSFIEELGALIPYGAQLIVVCARVEQTDEYAEILNSLGVSYSRIDSRVVPSAHANSARQFKDKEVSVLLMGSKCAQSHSFEQCSNLWIGSMGYSYSEFWQTVGRIWRVNSQKEVRVTIPYYEGTIEAKLWDYILTKESLARATLFHGSKLAEYISDVTWVVQPTNGGVKEERATVTILETNLKRCLDRKSSAATVQAQPTI